MAQNPRFVEIVELLYGEGSFKDHVMKYMAAWELHEQHSKGTLSDDDLLLFAEMLELQNYMGGEMPEDLRLALGLDKDAA